jgi:AcrR family transcriptional regulator
MVSYYFGSKERMLEALIFTELLTKMQLDTLRMENLDPLQKINKLIELYVTCT